MKLAIINLCTIEDISKRSSYQDDITFLSQYAVPFIDYAAGKETGQELLDGFHEALRDDSVSIIWFYQGGNRLVEFLDLIDWDLVVSSKKVFLGVSDFTHFAILAHVKGVRCFYGLALKNICTYFSDNDQKEIADLLLGIINQDENRVANSARIFSLGESICGGHILIFLLMMKRSFVDLRGKNLFIEYHDAPGKTLEDVGFYIEHLMYFLKENKPNSIVLGHSLIFDTQGNPIDFTVINDYFTKRLQPLGIPIQSVDHFKKVISFVAN